MSSNIKVAVRVRPFNKREIDKKCRLCIDMPGDGRINLNLKEQGKGIREYKFDHAFWSFDDSRPKATQEILYKELGFFVPEALAGFNCSVFAYGQTGAGKSYSMMGPDKDPGIIYNGLQDFFKQRDEAPPGTKIQLELSFLEVYNEKVADLLTKEYSRLRVRVDKEKGVYVQGLTIKAINGFKQAKALINRGFRNRTVASTKMNSESSRSHCIFTMWVKKETSEGATEAKVNLVDLAGSERVAKTGAEGIRLREANSINVALSALSQVINALANKQNFIPYRSSIITLLLRESLGGNSKTIMVCAISPADDNALESWSTLRYAQRAKEVENKVKVNRAVDSKVLIARLRKEIVDLKARLIAALDGRAKSKILLELDHAESEMIRNEKPFEERAKDFDIELAENWEVHRKQADDNTPRLVNISPDPIMTGKWVYFLKISEDPLLVGISDDCTINLPVGASSDIEEKHATIRLTEESASINAWDVKACTVFLNGKRVEEPTAMFHGDRLVFGNSGRICFHFISPIHPSKDKSRHISEIVSYEGIEVELQEKDVELKRLQDLLEEEHCNNKARQSKLEKETKSLQNELKAKTGDKTSLEVSLKRSKTELKNLKKCMKRGSRFDSELRKAVTVCRLATSMAHNNQFYTHYAAFIVTNWNCLLGYPEEKVMIQEVYETEGGSIDAIYDFGTFLDSRYVLQGRYQEKKQPGIANPFIPDIPSRTIGYVKITESPDTAIGFIIESVENDIFANFDVGTVGQVGGTVFASLSIVEEDGSSAIKIKIKDVILPNATSPIVMLTFIDPYGILDMIEGSRQEDGSYKFSYHKIQAKYSPGLKSFLCERGIQMFVSIFPFQDGSEVPKTVFQKLFDSHIELKRCHFRVSTIERELQAVKDEMKKSATEYEEILEGLHRENMELRRAAECCLRPKSKESFCASSKSSCCLPLPSRRPWRRKDRVSEYSDNSPSPDTDEV